MVADVAGGRAENRRCSSVVGVVGLGGASGPCLHLAATCYRWWSRPWKFAGSAIVYEGETHEDDAPRRGPGVREGAVQSDGRGSPHR